MVPLTVRRGVAATVRAVAAVLCCAAVGIGSAYPASAADPTLTSDASGPLFPALTNLAPGATQTNCLRLDYANLTAPADLGMTAAASGNLAPFLNVTIAVGSGGGFGSCTGFSGTVRYAGTLADLAAQHGDLSTQLSLGSMPPPSGSASVEIQVTLVDDNRAQGLTATASLTFALTTADQLPPSPSPSPSPSPTVTASPSPSPTPAPTPSATQPPTTRPPSGSPTTTSPGGPAFNDVSAPPSGSASSTPPASPAPSAVPAPSPHRKPRQVLHVPLTNPPPSGPPSLANRLGNLARTVFHALAPTALPTAKGISWTLFVTPIPLLFLFLQHRIDRRDPKLALAPVYRDETLPFDDGAWEGEHGAPGEEH